MSKHPVTEVKGLCDVWEYRGVRFFESPMDGSWKTYACVVSEEPPHGLTRLHARTMPALLTKIDTHLECGGEVRYE